MQRHIWTHCVPSNNNLQTYTTQSMPEKETAAELQHSEQSNKQQSVLNLFQHHWKHLDTTRKNKKRHTNCSELQSICVMAKQNDASEPRLLFMSNRIVSHWNTWYSKPPAAGDAVMLMEIHSCQRFHGLTWRRDSCLHHHSSSHAFWFPVRAVFFLKHLGEKTHHIFRSDKHTGNKKAQRKKNKKKEVLWKCFFGSFMRF